MRVAYTILSVLSLLLVSSCEKNFNINQQSDINKMAVNSLFNNGAPIQVYITRPYAVGTAKNYITAIPDAKVELSENGVYKEILHFTPSDSISNFGYYESNLLAQAGKTYSIKATEPKLNDITASDQIPLQPFITNSALQQYDTSRNGKGIMTLTFQDDPGVQNYYRINVWASGNQVYTDSLGDTMHVGQRFALETHPISAVNDTVRDGYFFLFSDNGFNGQQKSLQINFNTVNPTSFANLTITVELHTVSKAHYLYFETLNLYRSSSYNSEPVFIYNNVNNGFGDFVGEDIQLLPFVIK